MSRQVADTLSISLRTLGWLTEVRASEFGNNRFEVRVMGKSSGGARLPS